MGKFLIKTALLFSFLILIIILILQFEEYKLIILDIHLSDLKTEYMQIKDENKSIGNEINFILAQENLNKIAEEKNFKAPTDEMIININ